MKTFAWWETFRNNYMIQIHDLIHGEVVSTGLGLYRSYSCWSRCPYQPANCWQLPSCGTCTEMSMQLRNNYKKCLDLGFRMSLSQDSFSTITAEADRYQVSQNNAIQIEQKQWWSGFWSIPSKSVQGAWIGWSTTGSKGPDRWLIWQPTFRGSCRVIAAFF